MYAIDGKNGKVNRHLGLHNTEGLLSLMKLSSELYSVSQCCRCIEGSCWISNSTQASYVFRITHQRARDRSIRTLKPLRTSFSLNCGGVKCMTHRLTNQGHALDRARRLMWPETPIYRTMQSTGSFHLTNSKIGQVCLRPT